MCNICGSKNYMFVSNFKAGSLESHKMIGKLPRPSKGWIAPGYKYLGSYNLLDKPVSFNTKTGEIYKINEQPKNNLDRIAMNHNICYSVNPSNRGDCERKMVKSIDQMPYKEMNKTAMLARTIMNKEATIGIRPKKTTQK